MRWIILTTVIVLGLVFSKGAGIAKASDVKGLPSMSFDSSDPKERSAARVVMLQRDDFREIYCPFELLRERESKRLVVIDRRSKSSEMAISDDETVDSLLAKGRMSDLWRGSWQPQARLITKDAIYQSPASPDAERKTAFLKHLVKPGDILVIAFVD